MAVDGVTKADSQDAGFYAALFKIFQHVLNLRILNETEATVPWLNNHATEEGVHSTKTVQDVFQPNSFSTFK